MCAEYDSMLLYLSCGSKSNGTIIRAHKYRRTVRTTFRHTTYITHYLYAHSNVWVGHRLICMFPHLSSYHASITLILVAITLSLCQYRLRPDVHSGQETGDVHQEDGRPGPAHRGLPRTLPQEILRSHWQILYHRPWQVDRLRDRFLALQQ